MSPLRGIQHEQMQSLEGGDESSKSKSKTSRLAFVASVAGHSDRGIAVEKFVDQKSSRMAASSLQEEVDELQSPLKGRQRSTEGKASLADKRAAAVNKSEMRHLVLEDKKRLRVRRKAVDEIGGRGFAFRQVSPNMFHSFPRLPPSRSRFSWVFLFGQLPLCCILSLSVHAANICRIERRSRFMWTHITSTLGSYRQRQSKHVLTCVCAKHYTFRRSRNNFRDQAPCLSTSTELICRSLELF